MSAFFQGVGVACVIFGTGFLLAVGWFAGVRFAAWMYGPNKVSVNAITLNVSRQEDGNGE